MRKTGPKLTIGKILRWADALHRRTGRWPTARSGPVRGAPGERWRAIDRALWHGRRGLPGSDTLARLLVRGGRRPALWAHTRADAWTAAEDRLVRTLSPQEAARRTGRSVDAVSRRRSRLRLPDARTQRG
jgi:hypothetical protein